MNLHIFTVNQMMHTTIGSDAEGTKAEAKDTKRKQSQNKRIRIR